jgi:hypothetical protein
MQNSWKIERETQRLLVVLLNVTSSKEDTGGKVTRLNCDLLYVKKQKTGLCAEYFSEASINDS